MKSIHIKLYLRQSLPFAFNPILKTLPQLLSPLPCFMYLPPKHYEYFTYLPCLLCIFSSRK